MTNNQHVSIRKGYVEMPDYGLRVSFSGTIKHNRPCQSQFVVKTWVAEWHGVKAQVSVFWVGVALRRWAMRHGLDFDIRQMANSNHTRFPMSVSYQMPSFKAWDMAC